MPKTKLLKGWTRCRAGDIEVVFEQARVEGTDNTALIEQLENDVYELKGRLEFLRRRNNVTQCLFFPVG